jgi:hypothetical protein
MRDGAEMKQQFLSVWNGKFVSGLARLVMAWTAWSMSYKRDDWILKGIAILFVIVGVRIWMRAFRNWRDRSQLSSI